VSLRQVSRAFGEGGAAPSVANGLIGGIDHIPPLMLRSGRVLGARGLTLFRFVILPAAMPDFVGAGCRRRRGLIESGA
jgi:ABC-type nitrate/sulfonate/bicarbonate transport system permease component